MDVQSPHFENTRQKLLDLFRQIYNYSCDVRHNRLYQDDIFPSHDEENEDDVSGWCGRRVSRDGRNVTVHDMKQLLPRERGAFFCLEARSGVVRVLFRRGRVDA